MDSDKIWVLVCKVPVVLQNTLVSGRCFADLGKLMKSTDVSDAKQHLAS